MKGRNRKEATGNSHDRENMKRYAKMIWEHVARYTLLDFLAAAFLTGTLYVVAELVCTMTRVGDAYRGYAMQSIKFLGLIYIASILVTSCWGHIRLLRQFVESEAQGDVDSQDNKIESTGKSTEESESKC